MNYFGDVLPANFGCQSREVRGALGDPWIFNFPEAIFLLPIQQCQNGPWNAGDYACAHIFVYCALLMKLVGLGAQDPRGMDEGLHSKQTSYVTGRGKREVNSSFGEKLMTFRGSQRTLYIVKWQCMSRRCQ